MSLFTAEDEVIFLDLRNQLNTMAKVEEVLSSDNG